VQKRVNAAYDERRKDRAPEMWVFGETHIAQVAEAMGCVGIRVEQSGESPGALERAFAAGRPTVVDVVSDIEALYASPWG
jgi:thiamine pyrophosphate-dependent acetolactate synthase large subunit-like protein